MSEETVLEWSGAGELRLRLLLWRAGDRYRHRFETARGAEPLRPWLESLEGTPHDEWPPSPPLQQLLVEQRPAGPVALLLGMAGASHWSLSIEQLAEGFLLQAALHRRGEPAHVGSCYRRLGEGAGFALSASPAGEKRFGSQVSRHDGRITLVPEQSPAAWPETVQWGYRVGPPPASPSTPVNSP